MRRVSDFMNGNGNWDRLLLAEFLPDNEFDKIMSLPPPRISNTDDSFCWGNAADGSFSSKAAYLAVNKNIPDPSWCNFKLIWRWAWPERVRLFLWKALHGILQTNSERVRRHMADWNLCPICGGENETPFHVFRDCNRINLLWNCLPIPNNWGFITTNVWPQWMESNLKLNQDKQE